MDVAKHAFPFVFSMICVAVAWPHTHLIAGIHSIMKVVQANN